MGAQSSTQAQTTTQDPALTTTQDPSPAQAPAQAPTQDPAKSYTPGNAPGGTNVGNFNDSQCQSKRAHAGGICTYVDAPGGTNVGNFNDSECESRVARALGICTYLPGTAVIGTDVGFNNGLQCKSKNETGGICSYPQWKDWTTECTSNKASGTWGRLGGIGPNAMSNTDALNFCYNNPDCGSNPVQNSKTPNLLEPDKATGPFLTVYSDDDKNCYPKWQPWENKKCAGFGVSTQSANINLANGVANSPEFGQDAVTFCGAPGSAICNNNNPALNTPMYDTANGDTITYIKGLGASHWGIVTKINDPYCYPNWGPWQDKQCTGYKTSKKSSRLEIPSVAVPGKPDMTWGDAINFCLKPENQHNCSGPNINIPQYNINLDVPMYSTISGDTVSASDQGIGGAWGEVNYGNDPTCLATWETGKQKERKQYGLAMYAPKMNGISKNPEIDCNRLIHDISYTSGDGFMWTPDNKLCKDSKCYSASLVKECYKSWFDVRGNFLKRDPEYANFQLWDIFSPVDALTGAFHYYVGSATDRIPQ